VAGLQNLREICIYEVTLKDYHQNQDIKFSSVNRTYKRNTAKSGNVKLAYSAEKKKKKQLYFH